MPLLYTHFIYYTAYAAQTCLWTSIVYVIFKKNSNIQESSTNLTPDKIVPEGVVLRGSSIADAEDRQQLDVECRVHWC